MGGPGGAGSTAAELAGSSAAPELLPGQQLRMPFLTPPHLQITAFLQEHPPIITTGGGIAHSALGPAGKNSMLLGATTHKSNRDLSPIKQRTLQFRTGIHRAGSECTAGDRAPL